MNLQSLPVLAFAVGSIAVTAAAETPKLTALDAQQGDLFGRSVAVSGDVLVAGAEGATGGAFNSGSAYVFRLQPDGSWLQEQELVASDPAFSDLFGYAVAVEGDTAVVGAYLNETSGSVYVFRYDGQGWIEETRLRPSDETDHAAFGFNVAISGDVILVGASTDNEAAENAGAAYVFRYDGADWNQEAKFLSPLAESWDRFGGSVDLDGDVAVIGAYRDNDAGTNAGAGYVYRYTGGTWQPDGQLLADDAHSGDYFGQSVGASGDTIVVGAQYSRGTLGSAYVFRFDGATWGQEVQLGSSDAELNDIYGFDVAIDGDTIVVGAHSDDDGGLNSGSAYVYQGDNGHWHELNKLTAPDPEPLDSYGWAVAIDGSTVVAGAYRDDDACPSEPECNSGSAYTHQLATCATDFDGNGSTDVGDFLALLSGWGPCSSCPEDLDDSGDVGVTDMLALLAAWGTCP